MKQLSRLSVVFAAVLMALVLSSSPPVASAAQIAGSGVVRQAGGNFSIQLDDSNLLILEYWDNAASPPRNLTVAGTAEVECLGDMFGGQAIRVTANGTDSATGEQVNIQLYLVDGGGAGPDRLSVKARRADGHQVYFAPLRDLESGDISLICG
jgi:hypothetical protein